MNSEQESNEVVSSQFTTWSRRLIPYFLTGVGIFFIAVALLVNYIKSIQNTSVASVSLEQVATVAGQMVGKLIKIDVSGAVQQPGLYTMPYDSRIADVLITAGGLSPKADRNYISRYINLAQRVTDGMKVYFPTKEESISNSVNQSPSNSVNLTGLININAATAAELDSLSGVGPVTAEKIIAGRPYQNILELSSRGIVSKSVFEKIKEKISVN